MAVLDREITITKEIQRVVKTGAAGEATVAIKSRVEREREKERTDQWEKVVDRLIEWGRSPSNIDEDELESPSQRACAGASKLAIELRTAGLLAPLCLVPTGDGGIVFERRHDNLVEVFEIDEEGTREYRAFVNSRLAVRVIV